MSVSYTHLDVYKRQVLIIVCYMYAYSWIAHEQRINFVIRMLRRLYHKTVYIVATQLIRHRFHTLQILIQLELKTSFNIQRNLN